MSNSAYIVAGLLALAVMATIVVAPYVAAAKKLRPLLLFAFGVTLFAGDKPEPPPPVIVVKDIEIKSYKCDHTGCEITWDCGTNITVGVDRFIVQRSTRQIPARTVWSAYEDYGESMTTNWTTTSPQHASDVRWKIIVRKGSD